MRRALPHDIATLVTLMAEFYTESDYGLDQQLAEKAFAAILSDERLGLGLRLNAKPELSRDRTMRRKLGSINRRPFGASLLVR
jgi:hypothetical protein